MQARLAVTHDGAFHADDVFCAVVLLRHGYVIKRSRLSTDMLAANIVFDEGDRYNPFLGRYDHHQHGGAGLRSNGIPYAAVGLLWQDFGVSFCASLMCAGQAGNAERVAFLVDQRLIQHIDAFDNAFALVGQVGSHGVHPFQAVASISLFLPQWNEATSMEVAFELAVEYAQTMLYRMVASCVATVLAEPLIAKALEVLPAWHIVELPRYLPWGEVARQVVDAQRDIWYVLFPAEDGTYQVRTVPESHTSRKSIALFPEVWRGRRNGDLALQMGVLDAVFCHQSGFLCGAASRDGALHMAKLAVESASQQRGAEAWQNEVGGGNGR